MCGDVNPYLVSDLVFSYFEDIANGAIDKTGKITQQPELKVEVRILSNNLEKAITAIKAIHPYETPVINIIPLSNQE